MAGFPDIEQAIRELAEGKPALIVKRVQELQRLAETHELAVVSMRTALQQTGEEMKRLRTECSGLFADKLEITSDRDRLRNLVAKMQDAKKSGLLSLFDDLEKKYGG